MTGSSPAVVAKQIGKEVLWAPIAVVDPIMHFSGGVAAAFFFWGAAVRGRDYLGNLSPLALAMLSFGMASALAVGWEFCEFIVDQVRGSNIQRGLSNTMRDLALGLAGAFLFAIAWMRVGRPR